jgi:MFS transporter, PPP family, 3-phenylpropionic acid transporter
MVRAHQSWHPSQWQAGRRLAVFYGALFLVYGAHLPLFPLWMADRGLSEQSISLIVAAPFFLRLLVTPAIGLYADSHRAHRKAVLLLSIMALVLIAALYPFSSFWAVFLLAVPFAICTTSIMPLVETLAVAEVQNTGLDYGRARLWGSLTFVIMGLLGGAVLDVYGRGAGLWLLVVSAVLTVAAAYALPADKPIPVPEASSTPRPSALVEAKTLVRNPLFLLFLLSVGATQASHATFYTFGTLHWQNQGVSSLWTGALWATAVLAEVALFAWSTPVVRRFDPVTLLKLGAAAGVVRWFVMCFDPPLSLLLPLQLLHALTYGATHLAAIHFIARAVPDTASGTAQALYASVAAGVLMGLATLASGPMFAAFGGKSFIAAAALSAVGLASAILLAERWNGQLLWAAAATKPVNDLTLNPTTAAPVG